MKSFIRQLMLGGMLTAVCLLKATVSQATSLPTLTVFETPTQYCFDQSEWRGGLEHATFDYHLIFAEEDRSKSVDVFVGFRLRSRPEAIWLSDFAGVWTMYDPNTDPAAYYRSSEIVATKITHVYAIQQPMDLTAVSGDGELLVGYGIRNNTAVTTKDSFQEMVSSQRYSVVWSIGPELLPPGWSICLTATEMRLSDGTVTTQ